MRKRHILGALVAALFVAGNLGQAATPPRPEPAAAAPAPASAVVKDPFLTDLLTRLNSTDAPQREAAQKELTNIANLWQQPEILKQMSGATDDKDIQELIAQRLNDLKAKQAQWDFTHLPPISLTVNGANLVDLTTALNDALNPTIKLTSRGSGGNWTLDAKDQPFWDVFTSLTQQRPLAFNTSGSQLFLTTSGTAIRRYAVDGPAMAYVSSINYSRTVTLQTPTGERPSPASVSVNLTVAVDPRLRVTRFQNLTLVAAKDDLGNSLVQPGSSGGSYTTNSNQLTTAFALLPLENLGKTVSLTWETRLVVQATERTTTISDVQGNLNKPVTLGSRTIRVTRFDDPAGGSIQFQFTSTVDRPPSGGITATNEPVTYVVIDATGRTVWSGTSAGSIGGSMGLGAGATGPYKLEIHVPEKSIEIPVHLELKDVPLP